MLRTVKPVPQRTRVVSSNCITAARRLIYLVIALGAVWAVEVFTARGPMSGAFSAEWKPLFSVLIFVVFFAIGVSLAALPRSRGGERRSFSTSGVVSVSRFGCGVSLVLIAYNLVSGFGTYNPVLVDGARSSTPLLLLWSPIAIGSTASLLFAKRPLARVDIALVVVVAFSALLLGGRTVPGFIGLFLLIRFLFIPTDASYFLARVSFSRVILILSVVCAAGLSLSYFAAVRAGGDDEGSAFGSSNLSLYGYNSGPVLVRYLMATFGIIGESSRVTHAVVPELLPHPGFRLLLSDVFSFLPSFSDTITKETIVVYEYAGAVVFVSRPGGTPSTLYFLGGWVGVAVGSALFGLILMGVLRVVYSRGYTVLGPVFLILAVTFTLGAYGTGTPNSLTVIAIAVALTVNLAGLFLSALLAGVIPVFKSRFNYGHGRKELVLSSSFQDSGIASEGVAFGDFIRRYASLFARSWWLAVSIALIAAVVGLGVTCLKTPQYAASASLYVTSTSGSSSSGEAGAAYQGSLASQQRVASYVWLVRSDAVVRKALAESGLTLTDAEFRDSLSASATPQTVLLTVSGVNSDPRAAALIANSAAAALVDYVSVLETPVNGDSPLTKLTVVTPATSSDTPVSPQVSKDVLISFAVGLLLGLLTILVRDRVSNTIDSVTDIESLGVPVLASVPKEVKFGESRLVDFSAGSSTVAEGYRRLRTNLDFVNVDDPVKSVLVTSAIEGEGKTTTALNLASALSEDGKRVVLIGSDLRKPTLAAVLGDDGSIGLTEVLRGECLVSEALKTASVGFDFLPCGAVPPNPAELLGSQRMGAVMKNLSDRYDCIIVDCAPVIPVTDPAIASRWVDSVILVVRWGTTKAPEVAQALGQLGAVNAPVVGAVLNCAASEGSGYYYAGSPASGNVSN